MFLERFHGTIYKPSGFLLRLDQDAVAIQGAGNLDKKKCITMTSRFSTVEEAIETIAAGGVVIALDSEDRENEGDFIAAAEKITPQTIHLMISEGRGQLCMPILPDLADRLNISLMVPDATDESLPKFAVPLDHIRCETGISPLERTFTIQQIINPHSSPEEFIQPGHIFPLIAQPGGVLQRIGHTEASIDLARLAGLQPAAVLCEICSRDAMNMATGRELFEIAAEYNLPLITIDALIEFRQRESSNKFQVSPILTDQLS